MSALYAVPLFAIAVATTMLLFAALEAGHRFGKIHPLEEKQFSAVAAPVLALVGLLLAFAFSMAWDRFTTRREAAVDESNAIGTFWLRTDLLPEPTRSEMRTRLLRYVDLHFEHLEAGINPERTKALELEAGRLQDELWALLVKESRRDPEARALLLVTPALNAMIDSEATALAARENRLPDAIVAFLFALVAISGFVIGYGASSGKRSVVLWVTFVVALGGLLVLLLDMDRPRRGLIRANIEPYVRLRESIRQG